ncbi:MAG: endolytic transglycosylase MltG [Oscillospiraceae bacterium]|nr:endolytic transglycosylase MltG [Oscillospiraceae bacterium]
MEDRTGVFALADAIKEREAKNDRREEDALASIFAKRSTATLPPLDKALKKEIAPSLEKTAVIDRVKQEDVKPVTTESFTAELIHEEDEEPLNDNDEPFYVENTALKRARKRRKKEAQRERQIRQLRTHQSRKTFAYIFTGILLVVMIISMSAFLAYHIVHYSLDFTGITRNEIGAEVIIPPNSSTEEIAEILNSKGIISQPDFFVTFSQIMGYDGKYLDGLFYLESSMSYSTIIRTLQSISRPREIVRVTIPEGMTAQEIGLLLEENHVLLASDFELFYTEKQNVFSFERRVPESSMKFHQLEGYLFPDTYEFFVINALRDGVDINFINENDRESIRNNARTAANRLLNTFNSTITPELYKTMHEKGFTLDELITLASMVQAEADNPADMRLVASVFINRLNSAEFPLLQSDPTTYYVRDFIMPKLSQSEVARYQGLMDAYDTYITYGLPPGPINNPGIEAIRAVLDAPATRYYFFCANIETREVFYAANLTEHEANLAKVAQQMAEAAAEVREIG